MKMVQYDCEGIAGSKPAFFEDWGLVIQVSKVLGIKKTIALLRKNIYQQRNILSSRDVACLYDDYYHGFVDSHAVVEKQSAYAINYYTKFIFDQLNVRSNIGKKLLDFGCGSGELSMALASVGIDVFGIDMDEKAIKVAMEKKCIARDLCNARFEVKDISEVSETFDFVIFSDVVEHLSIKELMPIMEKASDLLNDGGAILIHTPNGNTDAANAHPFPQRLMVRSFHKIRDCFVEYNEQHLKHAYYSQVHINVMTPGELTALLSSAGFSEIVPYYRNESTSLFRRALARLGFSADIGVVARKRPKED